jgi:hypothetical protein
MPAYVYKTLQELRAALRARLGFGATGSATGASDEILNSFLQSAYAHVYQLQDWKKLRSYTDTSLGIGQTLIDYPASADPERLFTPPGSKSPIWVLTSGQWIEVLEGISADNYATITSASYPMRYEALDQINLWPASNQVYTLRIWYITEKVSFKLDNDRPNVDDDLIFLHALAYAKLHYKMPDAANYLGQWEQMQAKISGRSVGQNAVIRRGNFQNEPLPKPVRV